MRRGVLDDILEEHVAATAAGAKGETDEERRRFIRETAQWLFVDRSAAGNFLQPQDAWTFARMLWDTKPPDC